MENSCVLLQDCISCINRSCAWLLLQDLPPKCVSSASEASEEFLEILVHGDSCLPVNSLTNSTAGIWPWIGLASGISLLVGVGGTCLACFVYKRIKRRIKEISPAAVIDEENEMTEIPCHRLEDFLRDTPERPRRTQYPFASTSSTMSFVNPNYCGKPEVNVLGSVSSVSSEEETVYNKFKKSA